MIDTQTKLATFLEKCESRGVSAFTKLRLRRYETKSSYLHDTNSPLVGKLDRLMNRLGVSVWQAVLLLSGGHKKVPICRTCRVNDVSYYGSRYQTYCSKTCAYESPDRLANIAATMEKRHGVRFYVEHPKAKDLRLKGFMSPETKAKRDKTNLIRYGHVCSLGNSEVYRKTVRTVKQRYGSRSNMVKTYLSKTRATNQMRRGVDYVLQSHESLLKQQRSAFKTYDFTVGDFTFKDLQGYERQALQYINSKGLDLGSLIAHPKISIPWKDSQGQTHYYHPDFKVRGKKHLIEVKSLWTLKGKPGEGDKNSRKKNAALAMGYRFTVLVMGSKKHIKTFDFKPRMP